jgi:hypothetical protein
MVLPRTVNIPKKKTFANFFCVSDQHPYAAARGAKSNFLGDKGIKVEF